MGSKKSATITVNGVKMSRAAAADLAQRGHVGAIAALDDSTTPAPTATD